MSQWQLSTHKAVPSRSCAATIRSWPEADLPFRSTTATFLAVPACSYLMRRAILNGSSRRGTEFLRPPVCNQLHFIG